MINPKIIEAIESKFNKERFLFWYDTDKDYSNDIKELSITNAKILLIDELPSLNIKLEIAQSDLSQKFLFYSAMPQPEPQNDWLLSYRLKGKSFSADSTQILLDDLGLASHTLRPHLKARIKFLGARERVERLKKWLQPQDNENTIDLKIMTVIARADQADPFEVVNKVLSAVVQDDEVSFDSPSRIWSEFIQYQMEEAFWWLAKQNFGYKSEKPSLKHLFMCLLVTDFANSLDDQSLLPKHLDHFVLADLPTKANAKVFISRWRSDVSLMNPYVHITQAIGNELDVGNLISDMPASSLINVLTFDVVERKLLSDLKKNILSGSDYSNILAIITPRKDGFWANLKVARDFDLTKAYAACYDAIEAASKFFELKKKYELGFSFANAKQGLDLYKTEIFQFDQAYRHFHFSAAQVEPMGWSLLQDLVEHIESNYAGWFIPQFSSAWNKVVEGPDGLLSHWRIVDWTNQFNFYDTYVDSLLKGSVKRVFVLISDAFRFEAAEELSNRLSARNKYQTKLDVMLGVLPSYTSLGMASLLPHKNLKYKLGQNVGILADDLPTAGLDQRTAVLNKYQGVAIKFGDLLTLGKEKGREFIKPF